MKRSSSVVSALVFFVAALFLAGCGKASRSQEGTSASAPAPISPSAARGPRARAVVIETTLTVGDVDTSARALRDALDRAEGYVADASVTGAGDDRGAHFDVRVPAAALSGFLVALAGAGETASYTERTEDVTEQTTDLRARLVNARAHEKRVVELMGTKTSSLGEILEAEKELARIRESIELLEAQDRGVAQRVSYATVRITFKPRAIDTWRTPGTSIARAAGTGVRGAAAFFVFVAMAIVTVAPTLLPIALVVAVVAVVLRRRESEKRRALAADH